MQTNYFLKYSLLIIPFFLVACGGGSGDGNDNESDTTAPVITVTGETPVTIQQNSTYTDAGATAIDAVDGTVSVTSSGAVDTNTIGSYTITYTAVDAANNSSSVTRTVSVTAVSSTPDTTAPVITVTGGSPVSFQQNSTYTDAGATAIDAVDGTVSVTSSGTVDTNTIGSYTITYTAVDSANNTSSVTRTVNVIAALDTTAPIINITGTNPVNIQLNESYTDAGATAEDAVDGVVSVTTSGTVDTGTVGTYTITYSASDIAGNTTSSTRTVNVIDTSGSSGFTFSLYDDFSSGVINSSLWNNQSGATPGSTLNVVNDSLIAFAEKTDTTRARQGVWMSDPGSVLLSNSQAFQADFTIQDTTGDSTNRAQLLLGFPYKIENLVTYTVDTGINFYDTGRISYWVEIYSNGGLATTSIEYGELGMVDPNSTNTLTVGLDGDNILFSYNDETPVSVSIDSSYSIDTTGSWQWAAVRADARDAGTGSITVSIDNVKIGSTDITSTNTLSGSWALPCETDPSSGSIIYKYVFDSPSAGSYKVLAEVYSDSSCSNFTQTVETSTGTYSSGNSVFTSEGEGFELNFHINGAGVNVFGSYIINGSTLWLSNGFSGSAVERELDIDTVNFYTKE